jgi:MoaA/NifB/PqqE/SkfB family radical SAM enzyme
MNLNKILSSSINGIAGTALQFYLNNSTGRSFINKIAESFIISSKLREEYEAAGTHIPPFLIASISSSCNLHCAGCYARANSSCSDKELGSLSGADWRRIFGEASALGISFILLAGGEPLLRRDIIEAAAEYKNVIFPIFTNGTLFSDAYINLFDNNRNLIPVLSIEGDSEATDSRRGRGVAEKVNKAALRLKERGLLYGASITVTSENLYAVTEKTFVDKLRKDGCGIIFYVEYVPAEENTEHLLLNENDLKLLRERIAELTGFKENKGLMIFSFPGDEEALGGCLAAGRGFFHINPSGSAEPCPFSPFSAVNLKEQTILEVLRSPFFEKVRQLSAAEALSHKGGCTLFQHRDEVLRALKG